MIAGAGGHRSRAERDREIVQRTAELLASNLSIEGLFHALGAMLERFIDASTTFIALAEPGGARFAFMLEDGVAGSFNDMMVPPGSITARVLASGESLLKRRVEDWEDSTVILTLPGQPRATPRISAIYVPLRFGADVIGVLSVQSAQPDAYDEEDVALLRACALYLSVRIHEARIESQTARLADLASTDSLTGVANRRFFSERLSMEWHRAVRHGTPLSLIIVDIDFFKAFNDTYGHVAGDAVLQQVATALGASAARPEDCFARYGGEEFIALLPGTPTTGAVVVAERMRAAVFDLGITHSGSQLGNVTASLGVASVTPAPRSSPEHLVKEADAALYRAKRTGRNRVVAENYYSLAPSAYPASSARQNLPHLRATTIGSSEQIRQIRKLLRTVRLLTVVGAPGVGKSRNAIEAAQHDARKFGDGIFYVDCSTVADERALVSKLGSLVGVPATPSISHDSAFADVLRGKRALIFLDNCDAISLNVSGYAASMLSQTRDARIVATAREPLGVPGEVSYAVAPLATDDAIALLCSLAPGTDAAGIDSLAISRVCERLKGLPRAIELAAAQLRSFTPQQLLDHMPNAESLGREEMRGFVEWSYAVLSADEQRLLRELSVFVGGATPEAIGAICSNSAALPSLVEKALVIDESPGEIRRYFVPSAIRSFAAERLHATGELNDVLLGHARFFRDRVAELEATGAARRRYPLLRVLQADSENLQAALRCTIARGLNPLLGAEIAAALPEYWRETGTAAVGHEWLDRLLGRGEEAYPKALYAKLLLGYSRTDTGRTAKGCEAALRACDLLRELGDEASLALALCEVSDASCAIEELERADTYATEALALAQHIGSKWHAANAYSCLGLAAHYRGDGESARQLLEKSLEAYRELEEDRLIGGVLGNLGDLAASRGEYDRAVSLTRQGLAIFERMHNALQSGWLLVNLGAFELRRGHPEAARPALQRGLELVREAQDDWLTANALDCLARLAIVHEAYSRALRLLGYADVILERMAVPRQPGDRAAYESILERASSVLGADTVAREMAQATSMEWADIQAEAFSL